MILDKSPAGTGTHKTKQLNQIFDYLTTFLPNTLDRNRGCMTSITDRRLLGELINLKRRAESIANTYFVKVDIDEEIIDIAFNTSTSTNNIKDQTVTDDKIILKSRKWIVRITSNKEYIYTIHVDISYQYPLVPPKITIDTDRPNSDLQTIPLLIKEDTSYRYLEPALGHLVWQPSTKIWSIIAFLIERIARIQ